MEQVQEIGEALRELLGIEGDADPAPAYSRLWTEPEVCPLPADGALVTLGYAESIAVLRDSSRFAQWPNAGLFPAEPDDPGAAAHRRARERLYKPLAPHQRAAALRPWLETSACALVASLPAGRVDLVRAYAGPLMVALMGEYMGLPSPEWPDYWAQWLAEYHPDGNRPRQNAGPYTDRIRQRRLRFAREELNRVILAQLHSASASDGVVAALRPAVDAGELTEDDVLSIVPALSHTVISMTSLLAAVTLRLLATPDLVHAAAEDDATLAGVIEETLRLEPPVAAVLRRAAEACAIGHEPIAAGSAIAVHLAAANRDPERFPHPNRLDPARTGKGCRHLAFGAGPSACAGAPLARMAALTGAAALLPRLREMRLTDERPHYWPHAFNPGLQHLWVEVR